MVPVCLVPKIRSVSRLRLLRSVVFPLLAGPKMANISFEWMLRLIFRKSLKGLIIETEILDDNLVFLRHGSSFRPDGGYID